MIKITTTWRNDNPNTVWNKLAARLGREPTADEVEVEVKRIMANAVDDARKTLSSAIASEKRR